MASFRDGCKITNDGKVVKMVRAETNLSSDMVTKYSTRLWADGTASCDCPGWTRRVNQTTGIRECKHTIPMRGRTAQWVEVDPNELKRRQAELDVKVKKAVKAGDPFKAIPIPAPKQTESPIEALRKQLVINPERARVAFDEEV